jgi:electron transfer flavoprotein alpha subunit
MAALVLAEHDLGQLAPSTARVVAALSALGPVDVLVAAEDPAAIASAAAAIAGVRKVLSVAGLDSAPADALAQLLADLADGYTHIAAAASAVGRDVIPRLAAKLDLMPVTDIVAIHGPARFDRPIYAGNAVETVSSAQSRQVLTIRASAFRPAASGNAAPVEARSVATSSQQKFVASARTQSLLPELSNAQIVVGGGVSFGSAEQFALVETLAETLGAAVGATRAAVDAGYAPNDWQVGQTGKIIAPDLYIAIGISGALQHLAGIQGAKKIIAVNADPEAPIMKLADLTLVGDLFEIVPQLTAELAKRNLRR